MSMRIRGKETKIQLSVDGQDQEGSFLKLVNWKVDPDITIEKTQFIGEDRPDGDINAKGYNGTFRIQELKADAEDLLDLIDANEAAHIAPPKFVIHTFKRYRGAGVRGRGYVYRNITLTCTKISDANGDSYLESEWSFFATYRKAI